MWDFYDKNINCFQTLKYENIIRSLSVHTNEIAGYVPMANCFDEEVNKNHYIMLTNVGRWHED